MKHVCISTLQVYICTLRVHMSKLHGNVLALLTSCIACLCFRMLDATLYIDASTRRANNGHAACGYGHTAFRHGDSACTWERTASDCDCEQQIACKSLI